MNSTDRLAPARSIRTKLIGLMVGVCITALLSACVAFVWYDRKSYANAKQDTLSVLAQTIGGSVAGPLAFQDKASAEYVLKTLASENTALYAAVYIHPPNRTNGESPAAPDKDGLGDSDGLLGDNDGLGKTETKKIATSGKEIENAPDTSGRAPKMNGPSTNAQTGNAAPRVSKAERDSLEDEALVAATSAQEDIADNTNVRGNKTLLAAWQRTPAHGQIPSSPAHFTATTGYHGDQLYLTRDVVTQDGRSVGKLHMVFTTDDIAARTKRFIGIAALVLLGATFIAALAAIRMHRIITHPVTALANVATRVLETKDFSRRATVVSNDELGVLTDSFNNMLEGIQSRDNELATHRQNLESQVEERTRDLNTRNQEMRVLLDTVEQGFVMVTPEGSISAERSARFDEWFEPDQDQTFEQNLAKVSPDTADWFGAGWSQLVEGFLPAELAVDQLPTEFKVGDSHYTMQYKPVLDNDEQLKKALIIITDVTAAVRRKRSEAEQREFLAIFQKYSQDRNGFIEFMAEADRLVESVVHGPGDDLTSFKREVHTLKGNAYIFGIASVGDCCHRLETEMADDDIDASDVTRMWLKETWRSVHEKVSTFSSDDTPRIEITTDELRSLFLEANAYNAAPLADKLATLIDEPMRERLARMVAPVETIAKRLDKDIRIEVEHNNVRIPSSTTREFWSSLTHVLRNAVDHGIETREARAQTEKPSTAVITLTASETPTHFMIEISDDGQGIRWDQLRRKAEAAGLPAVTREDLTDALFADGVSSAESVTEVSGRGVGMAAVRAACDELGVDIEIESLEGIGTSFRFSLPKSTTRTESDLLSESPMWQPQTSAAEQATPRA